MLNKIPQVVYKYPNESFNDEVTKIHTLQEDDSMYALQNNFEFLEALSVKYTGYHFNPRKKYIDDLITAKFRNLNNSEIIIMPLNLNDFVEFTKDMTKTFKICADEQDNLYMILESPNSVNYPSDSAPKYKYLHSLENLKIYKVFSEENLYAVNLGKFYSPIVEPSTNISPNTVFRAKRGSFILYVNYDGDINSEDFLSAIYAKFEIKLRYGFVNYKNKKGLHFRFLADSLFGSLSPNPVKNYFTEIGVLNTSLNEVQQNLASIQENFLNELKNQFKSDYQLNSAIEEDVTLLVNFYHGNITANDLLIRGKKSLLVLLKDIESYVGIVDAKELPYYSSYSLKIKEPQVKYNLEFIYNLVLLTMYEFLLDNVKLKKSEVFTGNSAISFGNYLMNNLSEFHRNI